MLLRRQLGVSLDPPLPSVEVLIAELSSKVSQPLAIEAVWDGDTVHDWMVRLLAVSRDAAGTLVDQHVATITSEASAGKTVESLASEIGGQVAAHVGVPFFFASPSSPDLDAPRWKP